MIDIKEFANILPQEQRDILKKLSELGEDALNVQIEEAVYNAAGVIAHKLSGDFKLSNIAKRDVALFFVARGYAIDDFLPYFNKLTKYIKGYFALNFQGAWTSGLRY